MEGKKEGLFPFHVPCSSACLHNSIGRICFRFPVLHVQWSCANNGRYSLFPNCGSNRFTWKINIYSGSFVVSHDDGGVPLGGALDPVNLDPEPDQDAGRGQQDLVAVLLFAPSARRHPHLRVLSDDCPVALGPFPILERFQRLVIFEGELAVVQELDRLTFGRYLPLGHQRRKSLKQ